MFDNRDCTRNHPGGEKEETSLWGYAAVAPKQSLILFPLSVNILHLFFSLSFFLKKKMDLIKRTQKGQVEASSQMLTPCLVFEDLQAQEIGGLVCYC